MASFQYKALQMDGKMAVGQIEAGGRHEAVRQIEGRGLKPVSVKELAAPTGKGAKPSKAATGKPDENGAGAIQLFGASKKVSPRMLENFTRLLANLLAAGVPLSKALVILTKEASAPAAKAKWKEVHDLVVDGLSLADSLARSPETFPRVYVAMVQAGETGGFLDVVLNQIGDFQAREKELKGKVMTAMLYPAILLLLAVGVLIYLMVFFIPRFQKIFAGFGGDLPLITTVIVGLSNLIRGYGLWVVAGLVLGGSFIRAWVVSPQGKRAWEGMMLKLPIIGPLTAQFAMARFCRMLGTLLGAGVPLINGLNVARKSIGNQILVDAVGHSIERVKQGDALGKSLGDCKVLFAGSVLEMISIAEESGRLDQELIRIAAVTETDLDRHLKTAVAMAEPLMLFFIAGFIGVIFIGMVLPIFTIQDQIK